MPALAPSIYATAPAYAPHTQAAIDKMLADSQALAKQADCRLIVSGLMQRIAPRGQWWPETERQNDFLQAIKHDIIACYRGGYGCTHLIDTVLNAATSTSGSKDGDKNGGPKLIGFSDVTVLHACFHKRGWHNNLYGPIREAAKHPRWGQSVKHWLEQTPMHLQADRISDTSPTLASGSSSPPFGGGRLFAGCASVLAGLCGTPAQPDLANHVLALEDTDERPYRWDRYLTQLHLSGALRGVQAVLIGSDNYRRPPRSGEPELADIFKAWEAKLGITFATGLPFGHINDPVALPQGWHCQLKITDAEQVVEVCLSPPLDKFASM